MVKVFIGDCGKWWKLVKAKDKVFLAECTGIGPYDDTTEYPTGKIIELSLWQRVRLLFSTKILRSDINDWANKEFKKVCEDRFNKELNKKRKIMLPKASVVGKGHKKV